MSVLSGKYLSDKLRKTCEGVKHRLWIASPYIGGWASVRRVLGKSWWNREIDVKLLTDETTSPNGDTLRRFAQKGLIYHLSGLHAKLYIIDETVLLTSANLTGTAFSCRYEVGILLTGRQAESAIKLFESWIAPAKASSFDFATLDRLSRQNRGHAGEDSAGQLPELSSLPPDPGDFGGSKWSSLFLDYESFRDFYRTLASEYAAVQRIWPKLPTNFEVDGFLDFLSRIAGVSKPYSKKEPRKLDQGQRRDAIRTLAKQFQRWAESNNEDGQWRTEHSKIVQDILSLKKIRHLNTAGIRQVLMGLNCMSNDPRRPAMFLKKNTTQAVKEAWTGLLYGTRPLPDRMSACADSLFQFKKSGIQELLGFYDPMTYPLRNKPVNAGLRFFGFDTPAE
jgi:hypothetical protein